MRDKDRLTAGQCVLWTALGVGTGLAAGLLLSEWMGSVNQSRVRDVARRLRQGSPSRLTSSASVRAVEVAWSAEPRLAGLDLEVRPVSRGAVELHGWVPNRLARAVAGRAALAAPGIESVINNILVRGEDDLPPANDQSAADQTA